VIVYLDTSTVLRVLFRQRQRLSSWARWDEAYSSELLGLEARCAIDRLRLEGALDDAGVAHAHQLLARIEEGVHLVALTGTVVRRAAEPMPTVVKTLDALHLASAVLLRDDIGHPLVFATHDVSQTTAARALGFDCVGA
jgi:hypothetical protein